VEEALTVPPATVATPPKALPEEATEQQELEGVTFKARVIIHEALHLPLLRDAQ
jgi:hypothetical protein